MRFSVASGPSPSEMPSMGLTSASSARTGCPERASARAIVPEMVVLPTPPLPATAIFMTQTLPEAFAAGTCVRSPQRRPATCPYTRLEARTCARASRLLLTLGRAIERVTHGLGSGLELVGLADAAGPLARHAPLPPSGLRLARVVLLLTGRDGVGALRRHARRGVVRRPGGIDDLRGRDGLATGGQTGRRTARRRRGCRHREDGTRGRAEHVGARRGLLRGDE